MSTETATFTTTAAPAACRVPDDIELQPTAHNRRPQSGGCEVLGSSPAAAKEALDAESLDHAAPPVKGLYWKLLGCGFSFFFSGVNDGTLGPLIPYIQGTFSIGTGEIAVIYATSFMGWFVAAAMNPFLTEGKSRHATLGRVLAVGAALQFLSQVLRSLPRPHLSLPLYAVSFFVQTLGMALQDAHGNTFVSSARLAHRWLGFIHASYAAGTLLGPPIATAIAGGSTGGDQWTRVYLVLLGLGALNLAAVAWGFADSVWKRPAPAPLGGTGVVVEGNVAVPADGEGSKSKLALQEMRSLLGLRSFWTLGLFYFFELGAWMTAGGWVVEYLVTVRSGELSKMGYIPTGWNGGLLLGRILLAEPTFRFGERRMLLIYSAICTVLQLVFWLVPNIIASATALSVMGFFFGPFFATGISVGAKLLPRKIRSQGLSLIFVIAQAGASLFPSLTGLIATRAGVQVLQPIVLGLIIAGAISWWLVPKSHPVEERG